MKHGEGDRVRVKGWYDMVEKHGLYFTGDIDIGDKLLFTVDMSRFCHEVVTISIITDWGYEILEDDGDNIWTDEMFEGKVN